MRVPPEERQRQAGKDERVPGLTLPGLDKLSLRLLERLCPLLHLLFHLAMQPGVFDSDGQLLPKRDEQFKISLGVAAGRNIV